MYVPCIYHLYICYVYFIYINVMFIYVFITRHLRLILISLFYISTYITAKYTLIYVFGHILYYFLSLDSFKLNLTIKMWNL